mgnify:CR=1 FL=1
MPDTAPTADELIPLDQVDPDMIEQVLDEAFGPDRHARESDHADPEDQEERAEQREEHLAELHRVDAGR